ncbi:hypothetical protein ACFL0P_00715 [Candidatus Omnitrophota bacterium]
MKRKELEKTINRLWKIAQKDLSKVLKGIEPLVEKGETYLKDKSVKGKRELEKITLILQREKLYYELGKTIANRPKSKGAYTKKTRGILDEIKDINLNVKKKK